MKRKRFTLNDTLSHIVFNSIKFVMIIIRILKMGRWELEGEFFGDQAII